MSGKRVPRSLLVALAIVLVAAFGLRLYEALTPDPYISQDEGSYRTLAANLYLHGAYDYRNPPGKFTHPDRWPPGTPLFFAGAYALVGGVSPTAARIAQALVGTLLVLVVYLLATRLARGRSAGLLAAALTALYPPLVKTAGDLLSEPLGTLLLTSSIAVLAKALDELASSATRRSATMFAASGLLLALTVLTRTDYLLIPLFLLPIVLVAAWRSGSARGGSLAKRALPAAALALTFSIALTPWSVRNSVREHRFVPVTTGGATPLFIGTYLPGDGTRSGVKEALREDAARIHPGIKNEPTFRIPAVFIMDAVARRHPELNRDRAISLEAKLNLRRYALGRPLDFAAMMLRKIPKMWTRPFDGGRYPASTLPRLLHLAYVLFGLVGLLILLLRPGRRGAASAILAAIAYGTALHLLVVAFPRYNLPLMPLLIAAGAAGAVCAQRAWSQRRSSPQAIHT